MLRKLLNRGVLQQFCYRAVSSAKGGELPALNYQNEKLQKYLESLRQEFYALRVNAAGSAADYARLTRLNGIVSALEQHRALKGNLASQEDIANEEDADMRKLIEEENEVYTDLMRKQEEDMLKQLLLLTDDELYPALIFEVNAGAGGQEAMLFAQKLYEMYTSYFEYMGWDYDVLTADSTDIGGLRYANVIVNDEDAYNWLRFEAGVHRVQRVPSTEKSGRIHTSTASITVIPRPADAEVHLAEKDLKIETKRASGAGGQHVNTTDSAVRIVHLPTGIAIESQSERSQLKNREIALKRLQAKLVQQKLESASASQQATRKAQQGNLNRNEKIRTYNFVQDRITDHRIADGTVHNLAEFTEGGDGLRRLVERLIASHRKSKLALLIENWETEPDSQAKKQKN